MISRWAPLFRYSRQILCAFLAMSLEVRVKAAVIEEPRHCRSRSEVCSVFTTHVEAWKFTGATLRLAPGASVKRVSEREIHLLRGTLWLGATGGDSSVKAPLVVKTLFGSVEVHEGAVLVQARDNHILFTNLSARMTYTPRGEKRTHSLPIGFCTDFGKVTSSGVAETGYPRPVEIETLLAAWGRVYTRNEKNRFTDEAKDFFVAWREATLMVGPWYVATVERELAAERDREDRLARWKAQQAAEGERFRNMFRERIFSPESSQ